VQQPALGAVGRLCVEQPALQAENPLQASDVPPRGRQQPQLDAPVQAPGREAAAAEGAREAADGRMRGDR
jgi:hypothetical protein